MSESRIFPTTVDNTVGLMKLIETAIGPRDFINFDQHIITPERFPLGEGLRKMNLELAVVFERELKERAAGRLVADGYVLECIGELAQFLADNPDEVAKYSYVAALGEMSRWKCLDGHIFVPAVKVLGNHRYVYLEIYQSPFDFRDQFVGPNCRVLVSRR